MRWTREKHRPRSFFLRAEANREFAVARILELPIDPDHPLEILVREEVKQRSMKSNDAMWAGPLADIERQAEHEGRKYPAAMWHEWFKEEFLPDPELPGFDPSHLWDPDSYVKWRRNPFTGRRELVGSTTDLSEVGMRVYRLQMEACAATSYQVVFTPAPAEEDVYGR